MRERHRLSDAAGRLAFVRYPEFRLVLIFYDRNALIVRRPETTLAAGQLLESGGYAAACCC